MDGGTVTPTPQSSSFSAPAPPRPVPKSHPHPRPLAGSGGWQLDPDISVPVAAHNDPPLRSTLNRKERRAHLQCPANLFKTESEVRPAAPRVDPGSFVQALPGHACGRARADPGSFVQAVPGQATREATEKAATAEAVVEWALNMAGVSTRPGASSGSQEHPAAAAAAAGKSSPPPKPPPAKRDDGVAKMDKALDDAATAAKVGGVWMSDGSRHGIGRNVTKESAHSTRARAAPRDGRPTLRMAYLFSGPQRKASIAKHLQKMCEEAGFGLEVVEIDILVGGSEHDMLDSDAQEQIMSKIAAGDFDIIMLSPPCSRSEEVV